MSEELEHDAMLGRSFGRFRAIRRIGQGGFARVYEAECANDPRRYAVKVDTRDAGSRLRREFRALQDCVHPSIIGAIDCAFDETTGRTWLCEDYARGPDLESWVQAAPQPVPVDVALTIVGEIAAALLVIHDKGWLHRDVTPRNIVRTDERAVLIDFGSARTFDDSHGEEDVTLDGYVIGALRYMPPEQWSQPHDLRPAADLFQLGSVLFYLLEGSPPFDQLGSLQRRFPTSGRTRPMPGPVRELLTQLTMHDASLRIQDARAALRAIELCTARLATDAFVATGIPASRDKQSTETTMTTEQARMRTTFDDMMRRRPGFVTRRGAGDVFALPDGRLLAPLTTGNRLLLDGIEELAVPELRGAQVELHDCTVTIAAPCFQTLTTEQDGRAVSDVYRAFARCTISLARPANVQFSGPRGGARYACGVQRVTELDVASTTVVGLRGVELQFSRIGEPDPFATLIIARAACPEGGDETLQIETPHG